jgi:DNA-binding response OmpR family regulator
MAEVRRSESPFPNAAERTPAILVVEDEVLIRLVIADYLRDCGFKVYEAGTAAEAIQVIESETARIDLVFSDVRLPGETNGFGLAHWARVNRPNLLVMLTSGDASKSEAAKQLCENEPFFAKPYDVELVVGRIRAMLDGKARKGD